MRPKKESATHNHQTYMMTSQTWERRPLFRNERWADLLIDTLYHYRGAAYLLHEFVIMPDRVHLILTPLASLERAGQFIKGGFSGRAKKELGSNMEVWQKGFSDHRIRDAEDYCVHVAYVRRNPVRKHLCERVEDYLYSPANAQFELDQVPQGLKPESFVISDGAAEAAHLQIPNEGAAEAALQILDNGATEAAPLQSAFYQGRPVAGAISASRHNKNKIA